MCNPPQNIENAALTEYQLQKINELRQELGEKLLEETPLYDDQFSLLRWLQGWNFKCDEIVPRFKRASSAFRCMGINSLPLIDDVDELNDYVRSLVPTADYSPGGVLGFDRDGNIVGFQMFGNCHFKQLAKCGRNSDAYRLGIVETALVYKLLLNQERKFGRKIGIYGIADVGDCNSEHLAAFPQFRPMMQKMQELFPDILHKGCTINTHPLVRTAFGMVKRWLPEQSRDKIVLLGTDYHPHLVADIGEENLFVRLGGTKKPVRGHPEFGTLRLGGMPPDTMTYSAASNPLHIEEEALSKLLVPARQKREIEINGPDELDENGIYLLQWFWHCQSDIGFAVLDENGEELWPHLHLYTDRVPEYGIVEVEAGKKYKLMFDNSFSIFSRKEVKFGFKLKKKSDE